MVRDALACGDHQSLIHYQLAGHDARLAVPTPEHFLPLLYVAGATSEEDTVTFPTDGIELGTISMLSVMFDRQTATQ